MDWDCMGPHCIHSTREGCCIGKAEHNDWLAALPVAAGRVCPPVGMGRMPARRRARHIAWTELDKRAERRMMVAAASGSLFARLLPAAEDAAALVLGRTSSQLPP
jgi:hypothetical protein